MEKQLGKDLEEMVVKAREVRSVLLSAGESSETEAKRFVSILEFTEKLVVFRELVIQGKVQVSSSMRQHLKSDNYRAIKETLDALRGMIDSESSSQRILTSSSLAFTERSALRLRLVSMLEDLILSS